MSRRSSMRRATTAVASGIAVLMLVAASVGGCGQRETGTSGAVLRRGLGGDVSTLDPQKAADGYSEEVIRDLYEGLTAEGPDGGAVPALAESWVVGDDGRTYTFALRGAARWSNGDPVTADEVVLGMRRAVDRAVASPGASLLRPIEHASEIIAGAMQPESLGVTANGPRTVVIRLAHSTPFLPMLLARCVAFPVHAPSLQTFGDRFVAAEHLVTNGPYRLEALVPNTQVALVRNANYWDAAHVAIARVEHVTIADVAAELLRYRSDDLDMTSTVPAARFEWARRELGAELQVRAQLAVVYFAFNLERGPLRGASGLREALSLALDREGLTERVMRAGQVPAYSFVPGGIQGYVPAAYEWRTQERAARLERARRLYREGGYTERRPLRVRLLYSENEALRNTALTAAATWKEALGVEVQLEQREFKTFLAERTDRDRWDVLLSAWGADFQDPSDFLAGLRGGVAGNEPGYADADYDRLLDRAEEEPRASERLALLAAAERRLLDAYAVAPVYFPVLRRLVKPRVEGAVLSPMNHNYSKRLGLRP